MRQFIDVHNSEDKWGEPENYMRVFAENIIENFKEWGIPLKQSDITINNDWYISIDISGGDISYGGEELCHELEDLFADFGKLNHVDSMWRTVHSHILEIEVKPLDDDTVCAEMYYHTLKNIEADEAEKEEKKVDISENIKEMIKQMMIVSENWDEAGLNDLDDYPLNSSFDDVMINLMGFFEPITHGSEK